MPTSRETVEHLLSCCDAVYLVLGESAPRLANDACVVRVHEMSRSFGELALAMRSYLGGGDAGPAPIIATVLGDAVARDDTGALVLYAMAMLVGPRLLVSLRDAREAFTSEPEVIALLEHAAQVGVREILAVGEIARARPLLDDPVWQAAARHLAEVLEESGYADSFGLSG
jgi:hypothetical protein